MTQSSSFGSSDPWLRLLAEAPPMWIQDDRLLRGTRIGDDYEIARPIGRGGMGVVYLARDLRLHREVALKLHQRVRGTAGIARLEREARTIAGLSHPNVVAVYGVVRDEQRLFVVMEYVRGGDIRTWLREGSRSFDEIVRVYLGVARGLAAAHAVGIAHGDVKPDNLLVGEDGRARVTDFGLGLGPSSDATPQASPTTAVRAGRGVLGTRGYMAPEQAEGGVGPLADQFSFCVSLAEALLHKRPGVGASEAELLADAPARPRSGRRAAARIVAVGVRRDPAQRHADMAAVALALERLVAPPRRFVVPAIAAGVAALAVAAAWPSASRCGEDDVDLAALWAEHDGPRIASALADHPARDHLWPVVDAGLGDYARRFTELQARACEQPARARPIRRCLDARRQQYDAAVDVLAQGDAEVLSRAPAVLGRLDAIEPCGDPASTTAEAPTPDDAIAREAVSQIRRGLADAVALRAADRPGDALAIARAVYGRARELDYPPLLPEVLLELGRAEVEMSIEAAGLDHLEGAYFAAASARRDGLAFKVAIEIAGSHAAVDVRRAWLEHASALGQHEPADRARLLLVRAQVENADNDYAAAAEALEAALPLTSGRPKLRVDVLATLGEVLIRLDRIDDGMLRLDEAIAAESAMSGEWTLEYAALLDTRGMARTAAGQLQLALDDEQRALEITQSLVGPDHERTLLMLESVAGVQFELGRHREAADGLERVLAGRIGQLGPEHRLVAFAHLNLANALYMLQRREEAEQHLEEALRLYESGLGGAIDIAFTLQNLGAVVGARDPIAGARHLERAVAALEEALGSEHLDTMRARIGLADALVDAGRIDEATAILEAERRRLAARGSEDHPLAAEAIYALARARLADGRLDDVQALVDEGVELATRVEGRAWLVDPLQSLAEEAALARSR